VRFCISVFILCLGFMLLGSQDRIYAESQEESEWEPLSAGPITTWTAPVCGQGEFVVQPFLFYTRTRGTFNDKGHYNSLPGGDKRAQYQEQLFMQYGLFERLEISSLLVYQQNYVKEGGLKAHARGLGDSYLFLRYCAFEETDLYPHITGVFQLKIPTGKYQHLDPDKLGADSMGNGTYDHGYGIILTKRIKPLVLHFDLIYSFPIERKIDGTKTQYAGYLNYDFGVEYFLPKGFNLLLELNGYAQGDQEENDTKVPSSDSQSLTIAAGVGWSNEKAQALLVYQRTLAGTNSDANDSAVLTLVYGF
jgi:hypothetical protein